MSTHQENLESLIAASTEFRTWVGAADAAGAKEHIYIEVLLAPSEGTKRPFALIQLPGTGTEDYEPVSTSTSEGTVNLIVRFEDDVAEANQPDAQVEVAHKAFVDQVKLVVDQLISLSRAGGYVGPVTIAEAASPARTTEEERVQDNLGDAYAVEYNLSWAVWQ